MRKGILIGVGVFVLIGISSGVYLFIARKKVASVPVTKSLQATPTNQSLPVKKQTVKTEKEKVSLKKGDVSLLKQENVKNMVSSQWQKCKNGTLAKTADLLWNVKVSEGIPSGGTYAKGTLGYNKSYSVRVIIKPESRIIDKIKNKLVVGKVAVLRGNCTGVAPDGAVILEAF